MTAGSIEPAQEDGTGTSRAASSETLRGVVLALAVAGIVVAANLSEGAYFSRSWGWVALAFYVPSSLALILERTTMPGRLRVAFVGLMSAFAVWLLLSSTWSLSASGSLRDSERILVYVGLSLALAFAVRAGDGRAMAFGVLAGTTAVSAYALSTRLFPAWFESYDDATAPGRLASPLGYSNAVALLAVIGIALALGLAAHGRTILASIVLAAPVPLLAVTIYFTYSRGAWPALAAGMLLALALDPGRLRLFWSTVAVVPAAAAAIALASTHDLQETTRIASVHGHPLALWIAALCLAAGASVGIVGVMARRFGPSSTAVRRAHTAFVALLLVAGVGTVAALADVGLSPSELKSRFDTPLPSEDARDRLFSLSGNGRTEELGIAWDAARRHPIVGNGSGTYEYLWYSKRTSQRVVRDAHSLYAEVLAELGVIGLTTLVLALLVPLVAAVKVRRVRHVPAAAGAYLAWALATGLDWHWEMVGVGLTALLAGGVALVASDVRLPPRMLRDEVRVALACVTTVLTLLAVVVLVGNQALFAGREALARQDWTSAVVHGRRAERILFWSHEPELVLGDAAAGLGDRVGAREAYREAVEKDPNNWAAWLRLAQVSDGANRAAAYRRVHELNPREKDLPGE